MRKRGHLDDDNLMGNGLEYLQMICSAILAGTLCSGLEK
jgi:hypothetical protein